MQLFNHHFIFTLIVRIRFSMTVILEILFPYLKEDFDIIIFE